MAGMGGRRAPNVSQYIANLNAIPSPHEATNPQDGFSLEDDLAMFTNTQFFDFDMGHNIDTTPVPFDPTQEDRLRRENVGGDKSQVKEADFLNAEYQFPEIGFTPLMDDGTSAIVPAVPATSFQQPVSQRFTPTLQSGSTTPAVGEKRKVDVVSDMSGNDSLDDTTRVAAEEDKRRRNTAASARFRVKKKQREQALERTAKDLSDKNSQLESRIGQLETENKWLKNLITEKNENKEDIGELWRKFNTNTSDSRSTSEGKDGVGTTAAAKA
ncbi:MAG: hypothetical protein M1817_003943 [Caeruleum heppii]|nr:MAG: hypothetical protein M1817_003943 [Caeruleum heppii]